MSDGELHRYDTGDGELVFERRGAPGGPVFLLVHGIGMGRVVFADVAEILAEHGLVITVDLPGFGDSPEPDRARTIAESGDVIAAFARDLGLSPVVLVGHSMGAQVVAEAAARHPGLTESLVLIAPSVNPAERTVRLQGLRMMQDLWNEHPKVLFLGTTQYMKAGPRWFAKKLRVMLEHRLEETLPRVRARTLVLRGETDPVTPRDWAQRIVELLPDGRLEEIEGRGHEALISDPEPVATLIREHVAT